MAAPLFLATSALATSEEIDLSGLEPQEKAGVVRWPLVLKAAPAQQHVDPKSWFLVLTVDGTADANFKVRAGAPDETSGLWAKAHRVGHPDAESGSTRRVLAIGSGYGALGLGGQVFLETRPGELDLRVEGVHLYRFSSEPTPKLIGKANGKLGPDQIGCGFLGFTALTEHEHRAFTVLEVRADGPAAKEGLGRGDIVVGVADVALGPSSLKPGWRWFESSHEAALGRSIEAALMGKKRRLSLSVLSRDGDLRTIKIDLPFRGPVEDGFPLRGRHGEMLRADLLRWALDRQGENGKWPGTDAVNPAVGALALLGTGDDAHLDRVRRTIGYLTKKNPSPSKMKGLAYWTIAFQGMLFCEYHLRTRDDSVLPWIEEAALWLPTTTHESKWGMQAFGHGPDGLPYDNKALMAPAAHLLVFDSLARLCGVESKIWEHIEPYVRHSWSNPADGGHGAMGYNASYRDKGEFWSRTGLVALAEVLRGGENDLAQTLCILMEERHPWMLNSHAYGEPGAALGLLSLAAVHPELFAKILPQWRWRFLCAWQPGYGLRYSTPHMGAPYMGAESIVNLSYLLLFSSVNGGLVMATPRR